MDIHLEGNIDGIEVATQIPAELQVAVIYLTAYAEEATIKPARKTMPYGFIVKLFSARDLHATIQMARTAQRGIAGDEGARSGSVQNIDLLKRNFTRAELAAAIRNCLLL